MRGAAAGPGAEPAESAAEKTAEPTGGSRAGDGPTPGEPRRDRRRLALTDPLTGRAAEDRPESWGDSAESDADRLSHYTAQRPPHHGG